MTTPQKRVAFARVPRSALAAENIRRNAANKIVINKDFIDRFRGAQVSPDISAVLTRTGSRLVIDVGPTGTGEINLQSKNGESIADSSDIQRISMLGSFINGERKAILKESLAGKAMKFVGALVHKTRTTPHMVPISKIDENFVSIYRVARAQLETLNENVRLIEETEAVGIGNIMVKSHLLESARRISHAIALFLVHRAPAKESSEENRKINDFLLDARVLSWTFNKLTAQRLQIGGKDFEYRKLYFPKDPTKGIYIQFCELMNAECRSSQLGLLDKMKPYEVILRTSFISLFCKIPNNWDLENYGPDSPARALRNVPIMIVPCLSSVPAEEIYQTLGKFGDRGFSWNSGATSSPQDLLKFLGTIPKRVAYGALVRPLLKTGLIEKMFPSFVYNPEDYDNRGVYLQLFAKSKEPAFVNNYFETTRNLPPDESRQDLFLEVLKASLECTEVEISARLVRPVTCLPNYFSPGTVANQPNIIQQLDNIAQLMSLDDAKGILKGVMFMSQRKRLKDSDDIRVSRSILAPDSVNFLRKLRSKGYQNLEPRVERYLRSFLTQTVQTVVVEAMAAKLDAALAKPVQYDRDDFRAVIDFHDDNERLDDLEDVEMEINPDQA